MRRAMRLLGVLFFPIVAHSAAFSNIGTTSCSSSLSLSVFEEASFLCAGNLSLIGGSITSDSRVVIRANGTLSIDNVSITAPRIDLSSQEGTLYVSGGTSLGFASLSLESRAGIIHVLPSTGMGGVVQIAEGGDISLSNGFLIPRPLVAIDGGRLSLTGGGGIVVLGAPVPVPSAALLMILGLLGLIGWSQRKTPGIHTSLR